MTAVAPATSIALNSSWLEQTPTITNAIWDGNNAVWANDALTTGVVTTWLPYNQTYYYSWYVPCDHPEAKPIKLAMSEVARLRAAAQKDAKLKAILAKFTNLIEVTVDFD